jgi:hypothetical protein
MSEPIKGKSIRIYLAEGTPQGVLIAEIVNWTGQVLAAPRSKLAELLARDETRQTGLYFLAGEDAQGAERLYIGESDNVAERLKLHNKSERMNFWERQWIVVNKDRNLTKSHVKYLESCLIEIAVQSPSVTPENTIKPDYNRLPEGDLADMRYFLAQMRLILPVLGLDFLKEHAAVKRDVLSVQEPPPGEQSPLFEIESQKHALTAKGREIGGEFIVFAGSETRPAWQGKAGHGYAKLHARLLESGKIALSADGRKAMFREDVPFSSPSAAAAVVLGGPINGRDRWKTKDGLSYDDWQNRRLSS